MRFGFADKKPACKSESDRLNCAKVAHQENHRSFSSWASHVFPCWQNEWTGAETVRIWSNHT